MFGRIRAAWAALTAPTSTPAPSTEPTGYPHPDDYPTPDAWAAAVMTAAHTARDVQTTTNTTRDVHDGGRALQAHSVQDVHMDTHHHTHEDTHHHGGTVTNNNHGTVGLQAGHVNGGIINMGGTNSFANTVLGSNTNYVGTNNGGQVIQADTNHGPIVFGDPHR